MDKLIVNNKNQTVLIDFEDIISLNAWGRYTKITTENENHTSCKNLGLLEFLLKTEGKGQEANNFVFPCFSPGSCPKIR